MGDRRAAMLGRPLTDDDFDDNYDPEEEFLDKRIGYVVKHSPGKEPGTIRSSIETMWPLDDAKPKKAKRKTISHSKTYCSTLVAHHTHAVNPFKEGTKSHDY